MIYLRDYDKTFKVLADEYLISRVEYVDNLKDWSKKKKIALSEPEQPMELISDNKKLYIIIQSYITDDVLEDIIRALGVRWSLFKPREKAQQRQKASGLLFSKGICANNPGLRRQ